LDLPKKTKRGEFATMSTAHEETNKKRKGAPTTTTKNHDDDDNDNESQKKSYAELESELVEKDKTIAELKQLIQTLQSNQGNHDVVDEEDDLSDTELEELDATHSWNVKFLQLREYRILNGHCNVPLTKGSDLALLGQWVNNQRRAYGNVKNGKKGLKITPERIALLDGLGFNWGKKYPAPLSWEDNFEELQKYKKAMGHCNIFVDPKNPSVLAKWVATQRMEYKRFRKGRDSLLSLEQIGKLKEIGFRWKSASLA
jgi:Helicase associated domain